MFYASFDDLPPEIQEAVKKQVDKMHMQTEALQADLNIFFDELKPEHLKAFRTMLGLILGQGQERGREIICHFDGIAATVLRVRYGVCPTCAKNHLDEALVDVNDRVAQGLSPIAGEDEDPNQMKLPDGDDAGESEVEDSERDRVVALLAKWEVLPIDDTGTVPFTYNMPVKCKNCGQDFVSLEDRMIKPPGVDGCHGCQHKAAWG